MARSVQVYPRAMIAGPTWILSVEVRDGSETFTFEHRVAAGIAIIGNLRLLKIVFDLTIGDADTAADVDAALFADDIRPGPQVGTVWGNWQSTAEGIIGTRTQLTEAVFWADWTRQNTAAMRNDARRALEIQRGWTVTFIHQHEGDGGVTEG